MRCVRLWATSDVEDSDILFCYNLVKFKASSIRVTSFGKYAGYIQRCVDIFDQIRIIPFWLVFKFDQLIIPTEIRTILRTIAKHLRTKYICVV